MLFKGEPNLQIQRRVKMQGRVGWKNIVIGHFDDNGLFETNDESIIERMKVHYEVVEHEAFEQEPKQFTDEEIRCLAKEQGIKSWHLKSIEKLKEELEV